MTDNTVSSVLITGANAGIGKELARQLGQRGDIDLVYLGCRNLSKAQAAQAELEQSTARTRYDIAILDTTDLGSVSAAAASLPTTIDALVMNAGGTGGKTPAAITQSGATQIFAVNVLGHAALLTALIEQRKLTQVAVLTGSEAARGVPKLRIKRPAFRTTSADELASVIDGSYYRGRTFKTADAYGQVKYIGALWMAAMARKHPELRLVTMSPGGTSGTQAASSMPPLQRFAYDKILMGTIAPALGLAHPVQAGAARLAAAVTDPAYRSGVFYASTAKTLTGPVVDQAQIFHDLADPHFQDNADAAIQRLLRTQ